MTPTVAALSSAQQVVLFLLRTLIGWHFAYEGYFKLLHPAWSREGAPLERFSSMGYLRGATGPLADLLHWMARPEWIPYIDTTVAIALLTTGLLLMLGLLTQLACVVAIGMLLMFYLAAIPFEGLPQPRAEGTYLLVNKNLIEAAAVAVLMAFRTGRIAGLDALRRRPQRVVPAARRGAGGPADTV